MIDFVNGHMIPILDDIKGIIDVDTQIPLKRVHLNAKSIDNCFRTLTSFSRELWNFNFFLLRTTGSKLKSKNKIIACVYIWWEPPKVYSDGSAMASFQIISCGAFSSKTFLTKLRKFFISHKYLNSIKSKTAYFFT